MLGIFTWCAKSVWISTTNFFRTSYRHSDSRVLADVVPNYHNDEMLYRRKKRFFFCNSVYSDFGLTDAKKTIYLNHKIHICMGVPLCAQHERVQPYELRWWIFSRNEDIRTDKVPLGRHVTACAFCNRYYYSTNRRITICISILTADWPSYQVYDGISHTKISFRQCEWFCVDLRYLREWTLSSKFHTCISSVAFPLCGHRLCDLVATALNWRPYHNFGMDNPSSHGSSCGSPRNFV